MLILRLVTSLGVPYFGTDYIAIHQDAVSSPTRFFASTDTRNQARDNTLEPSVSHPRIHCAMSSATILTRHLTSTTLLYNTCQCSHCDTVQHDSVALVPTSLASPDVPTPSVPSPLHVVKRTTDVPPLDNFPSTRQTAIKSLRILVASPDPANANA
jgi:hypothetical protein